MTDNSTIIHRENAFNPKVSSSFVFFERREFQAILNIYGKMVASGHWKDYAISGSNNIATFAIFQRASEKPLYRITKNPSSRNKQGAYAIHTSHGQIVKRGHELPQLLKYFEKKLIKLVQ